MLLVAFVQVLVPQVLMGRRHRRWGRVVKPLCARQMTAHRRMVRHVCIGYIYNGNPSFIVNRNQDVSRKLNPQRIAIHSPAL